MNAMTHALSGERKAFALHDRPHEQPHHDRVEQQIAHERHQVRAARELEVSVQQPEVQNEQRQRQLRATRGRKPQPTGDDEQDGGALGGGAPRHERGQRGHDAGDE